MNRAWRRRHKHFVFVSYFLSLFTVVLPPVHRLIVRNLVKSIFHINENWSTIPAMPKTAIPGGDGLPLAGTLLPTKQQLLISKLNSVYSSIKRCPSFLDTQMHRTFSIRCENWSWREWALRWPQTRAMFLQPWNPDIRHQIPNFTPGDDFENYQKTI